MERENHFHSVQVNRKRFQVCQSRSYVHSSGKERMQAAVIAVAAVVADSEEVEIERSKEEIARELVSQG